jgi:hypothetical protein
MIRAVEMSSLTARLVERSILIENKNERDNFLKATNPTV